MLDRRQFLAAGLAGLAAGVTPRADARGADGPAGRWDVDPVDAAAKLDQPGRAECVAFSPDGKTLAAGGFDGQEGGRPPSWITTWEVGSWRRLGQFDVPDTRIHRLAFAPDGASVVAAGSDWSDLIVCRLDSGKCRTLLRDRTTGGLQATPAFSPDGGYMVTAGPAGVVLWDAADWGRVQDLGGTREGGFQVVVDPTQDWTGLQGRAFALGLHGTLFEIHPVAMPPRRAVIPPGARYTGPPEWGMARVLGVERPWSAGSLTIRRDGRMAAFKALNPDGQSGRIATFALDAEGRWSPAARIEPGDDFQWIYTLAFTPDGRAIVAGTGALGTPILRWDLATGRVLDPLAGHQGAILDLATTPDGWLASAGSSDNTVRVWVPRRPGP